jgi:type IV pilus assembly protein PilA
MERLKRTAGFSLVELLTIVAIISILAVIAIPQFSGYQQKGYDSQAYSDLRNAVTAEEAYFASTQAYKSGSDSAPGKSSFLEGLNISPTVSLAITANGASFTGTAKSSRGSRTFTYDSAAGQIQ